MSKDVKRAFVSGGPAGRTGRTGVGACELRSIASDPVGHSGSAATGVGEEVARGRHCAGARSAAARLSKERL